jgi:hypothetical protein
VADAVYDILDLAHLPNAIQNPSAPLVQTIVIALPATGNVSSTELWSADTAAPLVCSIIKSHIVRPVSISPPVVSVVHVPQVTFLLANFDRPDTSLVQAIIFTPY